MFIINILYSHSLTTLEPTGYPSISWSCLRRLECHSMMVWDTNICCDGILNFGDLIGCMIVELLDYRPQRNKEPTLEKPERTRAVLHPNSETLWADICSLNQRHGGKWSDTETLNIEARLLVSLQADVTMFMFGPLIRRASSPHRRHFASTPILISLG